jgi:hypothetical protein
MSKNRFLKILLLFVAVFTVTACAGIVLGSGDVITETRPVSNFDRIVLIGQGVVIVSQGGTESLNIESNANILELVEAKVLDGTLELGLEEGVNIISNSRLTFYVSVDDLSGMSVAGSGEIQANGIEAEHLEMTTSGSGGIQIVDLTAGEVQARIGGSGEINLAGDANVQDVTISGSGKYLAGDLCSAAVILIINGDGDVIVCATETLDSTITNGGSVDYFGQPSINSSGDGSGRLNSLDEK